MSLSDPQIERYSRQIVLPQIGGRGQERLLQASVALAGSGELARTAALYLAGAGVGRIALYGADGASLQREIAGLDPDVQVSLPAGALGSVAAEVLVACDVPLEELDGAVASGLPLVAGGVIENGGWLVVAGSRDVCIRCASFGVRQLAAALGWEPGGGQTPYPAHPKAVASHRTPKRQQAAALQSASAGVIGSVMSLAVLKLILRLGEPAQRVWLQFDAVRSTVTEHPIDAAPGCPACAAA